ncbi:hypothetical protein [Mucilaginibacter sp.]|uniref:hypothetical protein n=1 Tax=Mucilaginibacter sp. TaxID=1882438 RepID=UPI00374CAADB
MFVDSALLPLCLSRPALQALATDKVATNEQGELQGAFSILNNISLIMGPLLLSYVFFFFTKQGSKVYFAGTPYLLASILMLISTVIAVLSFKKA